MTSLAPHVTAFFNERLTLERRVSVNTCDSYAYAFKMLLEFAIDRLRVAPSKMSLEQIDAPLVLSFLRHLETTRTHTLQRVVHPLDHLAQCLDHHRSRPVVKTGGRLPALAYCDRTGLLVK